MNNFSDYFRPYPECEDVFFDDIENHKKHFLPICSVNLKFLFPERDEWVHFISTKYINAGRYALEYATQFTNESMYSFDIIGDKYKFEADWQYFVLPNRELALNQRKFIDEYLSVANDFQNYQESDRWIKSRNFGKKLSNDLDDICSNLESIKEFSKRGFNVKHYESNIEYIKYRYTAQYFDDLEERHQKETQQVTKSYELGKQFYQKYGHLYPRVLGLFEGEFEDLEKKSHEYIAKNPEFKSNLPEFFGFITDIKAQSKEARRFCPDGFPNSSGLLTPIHYNIWENRMSKKKQFEYIGCITEYYFRYAGATVLNAFHDHEAKKATMLLDFD